MEAMLVASQEIIAAASPKREDLKSLLSVYHGLQVLHRYLHYEKGLSSWCIPADVDISPLSDRQLASAILVGVYPHGLGSWEAMKSDTRLREMSKHDMHPQVGALLSSLSSNSRCVLFHD
jgi:hypothetical protein